MSNWYAKGEGLSLLCPRQTAQSTHALLLIQCHYGAFNITNYNLSECENQMGKMGSKPLVATRQKKRENDTLVSHDTNVREQMFVQHSWNKA